MRKEHFSYVRILSANQDLISLQPFYFFTFFFSVLKAISKGLSAFTETVGKYASSRLSNSPPRGEVHSEGATISLQQGTPGVVTIIDTDVVKDEVSNCVCPKQTFSVILSFCIRNMFLIVSKV